MREIALTQGKITLVDDEDFEKYDKFKWAVIKGPHTDYAFRNLDGHFCSLHREIMGNPMGLEIDHIDGNGLNNQKSNLKACTHKENGQNKHRYSAIRDPKTPRKKIIAIVHNVHAWKASPEDMKVLKALKKSRVEKTESDRVRAGLRALAEKKGVNIIQKEHRIS